MAKFSEGTIVRYTKSGKTYVVTGITGRHADRIGVIGWRDGREFGPIRFLDADKLAPLIQERRHHDCDCMDCRPWTY